MPRFYRIEARSKRKPNQACRKAGHFDALTTWGGEMTHRFDGFGVNASILSNRGQVEEEAANQACRKAGHFDALTTWGGEMTHRFDGFGVLVGEGGGHGQSVLAVRRMRFEQSPAPIAEPGSDQAVGAHQREG